VQQPAQPRAIIAAQHPLAELDLQEEEKVVAQLPRPFRRHHAARAGVDPEREGDAARLVHVVARLLVVDRHGHLALVVSVNQPSSVTIGVPSGNWGSPTAVGVPACTCLVRYCTTKSVFMSSPEAASLPPSLMFLPSPTSMVTFPCSIVM